MAPPQLSFGALLILPLSAYLLSFGELNTFMDPSPERPASLLSSPARQPLEERQVRAPAGKGAAAVEDAPPPVSPSTSVKRTSTLPSSPSYDLSLNSETSSPSPSIASFRIAQIVNKRVPTIVPFLPTPLSFHGEQGSIKSSAESSLHSRSSGSEQSEEPTLWDLRAGRNAGSAPPRADGTTFKEDRRAEEESSKVLSAREDSFAVELSSSSSSGFTVKPILRSESAESFASDSSRKGDLDAAVDSDDVARRMTTLLGALLSLSCCWNCTDLCFSAGPKMKIISKAPWDLDGTEGPIDPPRRKSEASTRTLYPTTSSHARTKPSKDSVRSADDKPKFSRSRSFSALTLRNGSSEEDVRRSEDALRGLGLGGLHAQESPPNPPRSPGLLPKPRSMTGSSRGRSFLDMDDAPEGRAAELGGAFSFPPPTARGAVAAFDKSYKTTSRGSPFDIIVPGSPLPSPPSALHPRSAPANITTFSASERAYSRSSTVASLSIPSNMPSEPLSTRSPSTPTFPSSPPSPSSSFIPLAGLDEASLPTSGGPGYTLISLAAARQRETDRVSAAAAQRKAMLPVEHIAGREEVVRRASTPQRSRESSGGDLPPSSGKTLKTKKSGFLKRMMGGDRPPVPTLPLERSPEVPAVETFRALPDDYVHSTAASPPPVTISFPHQSVDLRSAVAFKIQPAPPRRTNLLKMPSSDQLGRGLAPALSLRPVSTFFSPGIAEFLTDEKADSYRTPASPSTSRGFSPSRSPTSPDFSTPIQSPLAPSFRSSTTAQSSLFDDRASFSSSVTTPLTPAFSPSVSHFHSQPFSPTFDPKSLSDPAKQAQAWRKMQWEFETQIRVLKAQVERLKGEKEEWGEGAKVRRFRLSFRGVVADELL